MSRNGGQCTYLYSFKMYSKQCSINCLEGEGEEKGIVGEQEGSHIRNLKLINGY